MADAVAIWSPGFRLQGPSGVPVSAGYVEFYLAGTDDPLTVYANSNLTVSLGETVYTDSAGYFVVAFGSGTKTLVYTGTAAFKVIVYDGLGGSTTHDNIPGAVVAGVGGGASGITQTQGDVRYIRNANALVLESAIDDVDLIPFWDTSASANKGITYSSIKTELTTDFRADGRMFPVGTRMPFQQTTPPTGWTKETGAAYNDAGLRFTTGTVATGGTASFNTTFASRTPTGSTGNDTPSISKTASHEHFVVRSGNSGGSAISSSNTLGERWPSSPDEEAYGLKSIAAAGDANIGVSSTTGSSTAHSHSFTGNAMDFAVKYVEMCIGVKA